MNQSTYADLPEAYWARPGGFGKFWTRRTAAVKHKAGGFLKGENHVRRNGRNRTIERLVPVMTNEIRSPHLWGEFRGGDLTGRAAQTDIA